MYFSECLAACMYTCMHVRLRICVYRFIIMCIHVRVCIGVWVYVCRLCSSLSECLGVCIGRAPVALITETPLATRTLSGSLDLH